MLISRQQMYDAGNHDEEDQEDDGSNYLPSHTQLQSSSASLAL